VNYKLKRLFLVFVAGFAAGACIAFRAWVVYHHSLYAASMRGFIAFAIVLVIGFIYGVCE
jgi:hypothetical protein